MENELANLCTTFIKFLDEQKAQGKITEEEYIESTELKKKLLEQVSGFTKA